MAPLECPQVLGDGFVPLQMELSGGFMFCVELSEASGVCSSLLKTCLFVQELSHSYDNQVVT